MITGFYILVVTIVGFSGSANPVLPNNTFQSYATCEMTGNAMKADLQKQVTGINVKVDCVRHEG